MSDDFSVLLARLDEMEAAGHSDKAAEIAVDQLARAIRGFVGILGTERVRRGFASRAAGAPCDTLDPFKMLHGPTGDGELARRVAVLAVDMLAPAIGPEVALPLAGEIQRLGAGGKSKSVLAQDVTNARGDPQARENAVLAVRAVAAYWQAAAASGDQKARERLSMLGLTKSSRSVVRIEKAILRWAGVGVADKTWEGLRRSRVVADLANCAAAVGRGEEAGLKSLPAAHAKEALAHVLRLASPENTKALRTWIRHCFNLKI